MTPQEIRQEIYSYIYDNVLAKNYDVKLWNKQKKELSKLLKRFGTAVNPTVMQSTPKEHKHKPLSAKTAKELQEEDSKKGIWRPIEFYS